MSVVHVFKCRINRTRTRRQAARLELGQLFECGGSTLTSVRLCLRLCIAVVVKPSPYTPLATVMLSKCAAFMHARISIVCKCQACMACALRNNSTSCLASRTRCCCALWGVCCGHDSPTTDGHDDCDAHNRHAYRPHIIIISIIIIAIIIISSSYDDHSRGASSQVRGRGLPAGRDEHYDRRRRARPDDGT